ncbi:MAG: metallophosphoesterase family protein, partial [Deltaproteobacteria bacterium]
MRLCVIADTHIPDRAAGLPRRLIDEIHSCDRIVHAGDFTTVAAYDMIARLNTLIAVRGNIDEAALADRLERTATFQAGKFKVGVIHGFGREASILDNIRSDFDASYHLVIFG